MSTNTTPCPDCNGYGNIYTDSSLMDKERCQKCKGKGRVDSDVPQTTGAESVDLQRLARLQGEHEAVAAALWDYHHALDTHQHGGVAAGKLADAVEAALGQPWVRGATTKEPSDGMSDAPAEPSDLSSAREARSTPCDGSEILEVGEVTMCRKCRHPKCQTWVKRRLNLAYIMRGFQCKNCGQYDGVERAESQNV